ncbi:Uu.00g146860.m01.CDS01 [Anthostomella pinea]|uniref:Uu.00g146860.m01.CDS01 n=1 Tax=Anthostomella pinea TaxID=933095 RepID=A0AAI8VRC7_9PEZI|nr:Uu.00g146860.m01.CDS01 [Anthostomella pinea]
MSTPLSERPVVPDDGDPKETVETVSAADEWAYAEIAVAPRGFDQLSTDRMA